MKSTMDLGLVVICMILLSDYSYAKSDKWITPNKSICMSKGGNLYRGVCEANWEDAQNICLAMGMRLPNINELKAIITDCGGVAIHSSSNENINNVNYQACYKRKGFSGYYYWSFTSYADYAGSSEDAVYVNFLDGY